MSGSYFGEPNLVNERGGGSSRRSKKGNSDKPKLPQRGLGVAQLEKIRLHGQINSYHPSLHSAYPSNFSQNDTRMKTAYSSLPSSSLAYSSSSSASLASHNLRPNLMKGFGDYETTNIRYGDSQAFTAASWNPSKSILEAPHFAEPSSTQHPPIPQLEYTQRKRNKKDHDQSLGSSSQNSESDDKREELDLELRLSI